MINILIIGDPHFKVENIKEVELFIDKIEKLANEKNPDLIIILGDILHDHERLHTIPLNKSYDFINRMRNIAKTYIIVGNHDMCLGKDIPVLLYNGNIKLSQNIIIGDNLINDNGEICTVINTTSGKSKMYLINQLNTDNFIVNENHILSFKCGFHKSIFWNNTKKTWTIKWIDFRHMKLKSKFFPLNFKGNGDHYKKRTIDEAKTLAYDFLNTIEDKKIIDICVKDYLKIPQNIKDRLYSFRCSKVYWPNKEVLIDPYILGMWLCDGSHNQPGFCSTNLELINKWEEWVDTIDCEIVHSGGYNYYIRKKNTKSKRTEIGSINSSIYTCKACINYKCNYSKSPSLSCLNSNEINLLLNENKEIKNYLSENASVEQLYDINNKKLLEKQLLLRKKSENKMTNSSKNISKNHFINLLKHYNIYTKKNIPDDFIINDEDTRLKLLAGFIDTDGTMTPDARLFIISQSGVNYHLIDQIIFLARSLGFSIHINSDDGHKKIGK